MAQGPGLGMESASSEENNGARMITAAPAFYAALVVAVIAAPLQAQAAARVPAEWEPHAGTWMQWPTWESTYKKNFADIIKVLQAHEPIHLVVTGGAAETAAGSYLSEQGVPLANITWHIAPYDNAWMRDNGPVYVADAGGLIVQDWGFDAWGDSSLQYTHDDAIPPRIAGWLGMRCVTCPLVNERGTLEFNGVDTLITSWAVLHGRNPSVAQSTMEQTLKQAFGVTRVVWLTKAPSDDMTGGHVDGIARFISAGTVAVAKSLIPGDPDAGVYEDAAGVIAAAGFDVVRLPIPGTVKYKGASMSASYMNWLVANGVVVVTGFDAPEWDEAARAAIAGFFPGRAAAVVDTRELWYNGGGVHCVTNDQPAGPIPPPSPSPAPHGFSITLSRTVASPGERVMVGAAVPMSGYPFDAWAVVFTPDGALYSLRPGKSPARGAVPIARSVNGLWADTEVTLFDGPIPDGMPAGGITIAGALFTPGSIPASLDDAERIALPGYFDRRTLAIAP